MSRYQLLCLLLLFGYKYKNVEGSVNSAHEKGLRWCDNFCLCSQHNDERLQCMESIDIYRALNFLPMRINRLNGIRFNPITALKWCDSGTCFCNKETDKPFDCIKSHEGILDIINEAAEMLVSHVTDPPSVQIAGVLPNSASSVPTEEYAIEMDSAHRRRDMDEEERRNRRRQNRRNNRRGRKRNRNESLRFGSEDNLLDENSNDYDALTESEEFDPYGPNHHEENFDYGNTHLLPKHEAMNSNPMVTAMKPPTRREPVTLPTTKPSTIPPQARHETNIFPSSPKLQETVHSDFQSQNSNIQITADVDPILEVPLQRKTVAGRVSEDLQEITENVQHIRSDVVFNQRILLVTVGVAGVAMLGVLVLALNACCSKKSTTTTRMTENGRYNSDSGQHPSSTVTKVNIDEAW